MQNQGIKELPSLRSYTSKRKALESLQMSRGRLSGAQKATLGLLLSLISFSSVTLANDVGIPPLIFGVDIFQQSSYNGATKTSLAGGAEIMFSGQAFSHSAEDFTVFFKNSQYGIDNPGQPVSKDNSFNSQPFYGKLEYTTPSWMSLFNKAYEDFDGIDWITFSTYLVDVNSMSGITNTLKCQSGSESRCYVALSRSYTPQLYQLVPRVMHHGMEVDFIVDPRSAQEIKGNYELPFTSVKVGKQQMSFDDFSLFVNETTTLDTWTKNWVRSSAQQIQPSASEEVSFKFRAGNAYQRDASMIQCDITNTTCYKAKVVPVIEKVSAQSGFTTGGQILEIDGYGFLSDNIDVKVDGVSCKVLSHSQTQLTCQTGSQPSPSSDVNFVGSNGLKHNFYNLTTAIQSPGLVGLENFTPYYSRVALTTETPKNQMKYWGGFSGNTLKGYFKAPISGNYRFYLTCDDACSFHMGSANKDPSTKTLLYSSTSYAPYRQFFNPAIQRSTAWVTLDADSYYYMEVYQLNSGGDEHLTVAVELDTQIQGHHHNIKEQQRLRIDQTLTREQSQLIILNPSSDQFSITMLAPGQSTAMTIKDISCKASASQMRGALNTYWTTYFGVSIQVTLTMYDASDVETLVAADSVKNVYTFTFPKSVSSDTITTRPSFSSATTPSGSKLSFLLPREVQKSNAPISGSFIINCANTDGTTGSTAEIPVATNYYSLPNFINAACPSLKDKYEISDGPGANYYADGRDILIRFTDIRVDLSQFEIVTGTVSPLVGASVTTSSSTPIEYGQSIFYENIPFEWLYTAETKPQILVTVDGLPAVCQALDCGYNYVAPTSEITAFSLSGNTVTIDGSGFPVARRQLSAVQRRDARKRNLLVSESVIEASNGNCESSDCSVTDTQITCNFPCPPCAGPWAVQVIQSNGYPTLSASTVVQSLTVTSVTPNTNVNPNGGTKLTITGNYFPYALNNGNTVSVTFADGTICDVLSSSVTTIICETRKFTQTSTTLAMIVTVNTEQDSSLTVDISSSPATITSITPANASPVTKQLLTLQVGGGFAGTLITSDLSVKIIDQDTTRKNDKQINVVSVDNDLQTITIKFGGAYSGAYNLKVYSETYGGFDTTGIVLTAIGQVSDFTPKSGSKNGGTLITITGYTFGTEATDNPVKIGDTYCDVVSTSATQITCRTQPRTSVLTTETLIVFLKTSEEAVCNVVGNCQFTWLENQALPSLTSFETTYNDGLQKYQVTLTGTGFPSSASDVTFIVDGFAQTVTSSSATSIVITIDQMLSSFSSNVQFYLPEGTPVGAEQLINEGITLIPKLLSINVGVVSPAGSLITAQASGVGVSTTQLTLATASGTNICASVSIPSYGVIKCTTTVATIATTNLKLVIGSTSYSCNTCSYATSTSMPVVTALTLDTGLGTISVTGTGFLDQSAGFTASLTFAGVAADLVTVSSSVELVASFSKGVPIAATAIAPVIVFSANDDSGIKHWAKVNTGVTLQNALASTPVATSSSCSFAGGCSLSISALGLSSQLADSTNNQVKVCGQTCNFLADSSDISTAKCSVPQIATTYSVQNFHIDQYNYIMGTVFASNATSIPALTNGVNQDYYIDNNPTCNFGTSFRDGYVGQIVEVKYFMPIFTRTNFVGNLKFQGSADGETYTDIFTVQQEIHEGWNYYDFRDAPLNYRFYRFSGAIKGACKIGEFSLRGVEVIASTASTYTCPVTINLAGQTQILAFGSVVYDGAVTPNLTSISPRFGKVQGGDTITLTGTGFSSTVSDITVTFDGRNCAVQTASAIQITCVTSNRPGLYPNPTTVIQIAGKGKVATNGRVFRYANYWSQIDTWGGEFPPIEGESVYIPAGMNLLVDVDSTPVLQAVVVEGSLIFAPHPSNANHLRTFDAHYVFVNAGYLEIGTEEYPYSSKLIITMHGNKQSPEIPIYGNKVIGVRKGTIDFHGVPRDVTWTELEETVEANQNTITLIEAVDWQVGEQIVIAPTGYDNRAAELRTIAAIDRSTVSKPVITLDSPLDYQHYAGVQTFGSDTFEMRAEVGLVTRNVVYRGDPETSSANQFGAHIMMHSSGDETTIGRISYVEFRDVGQAFQLGRYPIHFHLIGTVHNSYVIGNSIHNTYNRACTIHGVHYLRVMYNVAYATMGHTFFIEDAIETKNYLYKNLAVQTMASFSLLITDQTPGSFWITHPDNQFIGNHAAGSDRYGYWFDTKPNPMGPSFTPDICPENAQLGAFRDNVAHSNGRYGLRIFHNLIPRERPCDPLRFDFNNKDDPYSFNRPVTAEFVNFRGWKNNRNGAIAEKVGDVRFINFKVADNLIAGIEFSLTGEMADGYARIENALVVGASANAEQITKETFLYGIITPRTENFTVNGAKFYNFNYAGSAAIGSCSHCFHPASTDSGARTITFQNIFFDAATIPIKVRYQFPFRDIFYDKDGTLTGQQPRSWATYKWPHNDQPECTKDVDVWDGYTCDNTVQIRRIALHNYAPTIFEIAEIKITRWDDNLVGSNKTLYIGSLDNDTQVSVIPFKPKLDPNKGWAIPYVTGHKYKVHWRYGLDFTQMQMDLSNRWASDDKNVQLVFNFTDQRQKVEFLTGGQSIENMTLTNKSNSLWQTGDNIVYNDTATREIHVAVNGRNSSRSSVLLKGYRCVGSCLGAIIDVPVEDKVRRWSDPESWTTKSVPKNGEDVLIEPGWNMLYDMADSDPPTIYRYIELQGRLTFEDADKDLTLRAKYIFVRSGELIIGNTTIPYQRNANIVLYGEKENQQIVYSNAIEAGNKILLNTASLSIVGKARSRISRLTQSAQKGATKIFVETGLDWKAGDELALPSSTMRYLDVDDNLQITAYNPTTGEVTLNNALKHYHYGAATSTASNYNGIDLRNEVYLLTRNIKIQGQDVDAWGCQILTSDFLDGEVVRKGITYISNVQIYNCSQYDTYKAALRFESANIGWSHIKHSTIHNGWGYGINVQSSSNVKLQENIVWSFVKRSVNVYGSSNVTIDGNHVSLNFERQLLKADNVFEPTGAIIVCTELEAACSDIKIINNVASSAHFTGFAVTGGPCGDYSKHTFLDNIAHSVRDTGAIIFADPGQSTLKTCTEAARFAAYKCGLDGIVGFHDGAWQQIIFSSLTMIDNGKGATAMVGIEGDNLKAEIKDSKFYGESEALDCNYENECLKVNHEGCKDRAAITLSYFARAGKDPLPKAASKIPVHKIKTDASYGGKTVYTNNQFLNFGKATTKCGASQAIFIINDYAADYIPEARIYNSKFTNCALEAFSYIFSPPASWANLDDCGDFPCTAPNNVVMQFYQNTYSGTVKPSKQDQNFQIVSGNTPAVKGYQSCSKQDTWNAYYCTNDYLGVLLFESLDSDSWKRLVSPIYVKNNATGSINTLNTFMDHIWDGFYTGQLRMARWPSTIEVGTGKTYDIVYSGTPPEKQRFSLVADYSGVVLRIDYPKTGTYAVTDFNGQIIAANAWDDTAKAPATLKRARCGENRFIGVENILEFYITAGCNLMIQPIDSIQTKIRMSWTLEGFYSAGGATKFVDRLASVLGIHASTIKVVSVYTGSVIVEVQITPPGTGTQTIANVKSNIKKMLTSGSTDLGAPIIGLSVDDAAIVTDSTTNNGGNNGGNNNGNNGGTTGNTGGNGQIIYNNTQTVVVAESGSSSGDQVKLIIIFAVIVVVIIAGSVASYFIYKRYKSKKLLDNVNKQLKVNNDSVGRDSMGQSNMVGDEEKYEPQYHPKAELGNIFGGKVSKVNKADEVAEDSMDGDIALPHHSVDTDQSQDVDQKQYESTPLAQNPLPGDLADQINSQLPGLTRKRTSLRVTEAANKQGSLEQKVYQNV